MKSSHKLRYKLKHRRASISEAVLTWHTIGEIGFRMSNFDYFRSLFHMANARLDDVDTVHPTKAFFQTHCCASFSPSVHNLAEHSECLIAGIRKAYLSLEDVLLLDTHEWSEDHPIRIQHRCHLIDMQFRRWQLILRSLQRNNKKSLVQ